MSLLHQTDCPRVDGWARTLIENHGVRYQRHLGKSESVAIVCVYLGTSKGDKPFATYRVSAAGVDVTGSVYAEEGEDFWGLFHKVISRMNRNMVKAIAELTTAYQTNDWPECCKRV